MHRHIRIDYACTHCILMQSYNSAWMMICMFVCVCACMWCFCGRVREIINLECWMKCMCVAEWSTQRGQWIFLCLTNIAEGLTLDTLPVPPPLNPLPPWSLLHPPLKGQEDSSGVCPPDILFWGRSSNCTHTQILTGRQPCLHACMPCVCLWVGCWCVVVISIRCRRSSLFQFWLTFLLGFPIVSNYIKSHDVSTDREVVVNTTSLTDSPLWSTLSSIPSILFILCFLLPISYICPPLFIHMYFLSLFCTDLIDLDII